MKTLEELRPLRTRSWNQLEESSLCGQLTLEKCKVVWHPRNTPLVTTEGRATVHAPGTPPQKTDKQNKQGLPK